MNEYTGGLLDDPLVSALLRAAEMLRDRIEGALGEVGLSGARYSVLEELARTDEPLALGELAARVSCVRSNMTQLTDRLEADGLVRRVRDPADRRCVRAELTQAGTKRQRAGAEKLRAVHGAFMGGLAVEDRAALLEALRAIT
ncbi:MAG: MarR family transcriptional regulator [Gemmatimonadota bacterium]